MFIKKSVFGGIEEISNVGHCNAAKKVDESECKRRKGKINF